MKKKKEMSVIDVKRAGYAARQSPLQRHQPAPLELHVRGEVLKVAKRTFAESVSGHPRTSKDRLRRCRDRGA